MTFVPLRARAALLLAGLSFVVGCRDSDLTAPKHVSPGSPSASISVSQTITPQVSAGNAHTCALKTDGTVICWGDDGSGQATAASGLASVSQVDAGFYDSCAVEANGTLVCWGDDTFGQASVPSTLGAVRQVAAGFLHTCALRTDATVACWGYDALGEATVPSTLGAVAQVDAGAHHTCALRTDGAVVCWGYDALGQSTVPSTLGAATHLGTGHYHTCAVKTDGSVVCWGDNFYGQATPPSDLTSVAQVSAGAAHSCALKTDGTVVCWGNNGNGQTTVPTELASVAEVSAGGYHTCARKTDGTVVCWGDNFSGQSAVPGDLNLIGSAPPVADAGGPYGGMEGSAVTFDGSASSTTPAGRRLSYTWDFDDGTPPVTVSTATVQHTYADGPRAYEVRLTVTDVASGLTTTQTATATILNVAPPVNAGADATITSGEQFTLNGSLSDAGVNDSPWQFSINWNDGSAAESGTNPSQGAITGTHTHRYSRAGTYPVSLTVVDKDGGSGAGALRLTVVRLAVTVSIAPFDKPSPKPLYYNPAKPSSWGRVVVAILGSSTFDAAQVDPATVTLGDGVGPGVGVARSNVVPLSYVRDVNRDGYADRVVSFVTQQLVAAGYLSVSTYTPQTLVLLGDHADGRQFRGQDQVVVKLTTHESNTDDDREEWADTPNGEP